MTPKKPTEVKENSSQETPDAPEELISNSVPSPKRSKEKNEKSSQETANAPKELISNSIAFPKRSKKKKEKSSQETANAPKELISNSIASPKRPRNENGNSSKETPKELILNSIPSPKRSKEKNEKSSQETANAPKELISNSIPSPKRSKEKKEKSSQETADAPKELISNSIASPKRSKKKKEKSSQETANTPKELISNSIASPKRSRKKKKKSSQETADAPKELISNSIASPKRSKKKKEKSSQETANTPKELISNSIASPKRSRKKKKKSSQETPNTPKELISNSIASPKRSRKKKKKSSQETPNAPKELISNAIIPPKRPRNEKGNSSKETPKELISNPIRPSKRVRKEIVNSPKETSKEGKNKASTSHQPKIAFGSPTQEERYSYLKKRKISPTVYWDEDTVQTLGFEADVDHMFTNIGWKNFVEMKFPVYEAITLEFLSSLTVKDLNLNISNSGGDEEDDSLVCFRLFNTDHSLGFATINSIFGFPIGGDKSQKPPGFNAQYVWNFIGGCGTFVASSSKVSQIGHPLAKLLQRFMSHTLFGRDESQQHVRSTELMCIWAMLTAGVRIDCGLHMIKHFLHRASQGNGPIIFGGLITPIAIHVQKSNELHQYKPKSEIVPTFTISYCILKNVICKSHLHGYYSVLADQDGVFPLPNPARSIRDGSFSANTELRPLQQPQPQPSEQSILDTILACVNSLLSQFQAHQAAFLEHTTNFKAHQEEFRNFQAKVQSRWCLSGYTGQVSPIPPPK
ncbi:hypothetical protein VNO78_33481 [Psophocarpus tetragonolobus]|uniref:Arabidopsis retrotransposon Orf1 C-terminal domain-containing protein n=1 Tax=Psophocarpus tetragonolobus TaxID=3891 RepID=A0AAN9P178_PSOTE